MSSNKRVFCIAVEIDLDPFADDGDSEAAFLIANEVDYWAARALLNGCWAGWWDPDKKGVTVYTPENLVADIRDGVVSPNEIDRTVTE